MIKSAVATAGDVARAAVRREPLLRSAEDVEAIIKTHCEACEFYQRSRCLKCGCWSRFKARLAASSCPLGKW
jgi:hypothetical protein